MNRLIIGIAGGSGSGKTTVAKRISQEVGLSRSIIIQQDNYYKDRSKLPLHEREKINYDHPDSFDNKLFVYQMKKLKSGKPVKMPNYDFSTHSRRKNYTPIESKEVIIIEGSLLYCNKVLRNIIDVKLFMSTPPDIRLIRRIKRDIRERNRKLESILNQYQEFVRPMHMKFVELSKKFADIVIMDNEIDTVVKEILATI